MTAKLELQDVSLSFAAGTDAGSKLHVLDGLSLHVKQGEFVSIIGPSGSGKSTIFHLIGGLHLPAGGRILMDGQDINGTKGLISYMPQNNTLFPWRTIEQNVMLSLEIAGMPRKKALPLVREWLSKVGLGGYENAYPHVLSGGMRQRAAFVRALLSPQELMCLDEPFGALDALTRLDMQRWLLGIWEQNKRSVLFVTHSIEEALFLSDRIYVLSNKPTRVLHEVVVPFSRPRAEGVKLEHAFTELTQLIYEMMRSEQRDGLE